jgi:hypothetical protein
LSHLGTASGSDALERMMRRNNFLIGAACLALAAAAFLAYVAYQIVGWLGVGVLGLLIACLAVRAELETTTVNYQTTSPALSRT